MGIRDAGSPGLYRAVQNGFERGEIELGVGVEAVSTRIGIVGVRRKQPIGGDGRPTPVIGVIQRTHDEVITQIVEFVDVQTIGAGSDGTAFGAEDVVPELLGGKYIDGVCSESDAIADGVRSTGVCGFEL